MISEVNGPWHLEDRPIPALGPHQVRVRVHACAICGTDTWMAHGVLSFKEFPLVLGHDGVGEVVAVGEGDRARGRRPAGHADGAEAVRRL